VGGGGGGDDYDYDGINSTKKMDSLWYVASS
jgi:hypothetical protein